MSEIINQCCYTHIGSWTTVAQKGNFEQLYIGELSRHSTFTDYEFKNALSVFETIGYGDKFLLMQTKYGLRDLATASKRDSMFSHGYLIDTSEGPFDPNVFLTISKENFCTNEEDADKEKNGFQRIESFTLETAVVKAGLNRDSFSKLIKCVYQLAVRSINKQALFIRAKDEEQSLALLYCIYSALMPRYSKFLSSSSVEYNFSGMRNIVFTQSVNTSRKYFIPETGENNVLSANVEKNIDSLYFVDYAANNFNTTEDIQAYYSEFEQALKKISDAKQVDDDVIRLAHVMTVDPVPSKECDVISDDEALMSILKHAEEFNEESQNDEVKDYIEKLREEATERGLIKAEEPEPVDLKIESDEDMQYDDVYETSEYRDMYDTSFTNGSSSGDVTFNRNGSKHISQDDSCFLSNYERIGFKNNLLSCASFGMERFPDFKHKIDMAVNSDKVKYDVNSKKEYADIIYEGLCELITVNAQDKNAVFEDNPVVLLKNWYSKLNLNDSDVDYYQNKLITYYWNAFKWRTFDEKKANEYKMFIVPRQFNTNLSLEEDLVNKACNVNNITELMLMQNILTAEGWFYKLNKIFKEDFSYEDREHALSILEEFYSEKIAKEKRRTSVYSDSFCVKYFFKFAVDFQTSEFEKIMEAWQLVYLFLINNSSDKKDIKVVIKAIEGIAFTEYDSEENKQCVFDSMCDLLVELESRQITVPFDIWFALGEVNGEHPLGVFYEREYEPLVKSTPIPEIVKTSILLKNERYLNILLDSDTRKIKDKFIKNLIKTVNRQDNHGSRNNCQKLKSIFGQKINKDNNKSKDNKKNKDNKKDKKQLD